VRQVHVAPALIDYVQALVAHTRHAATWQHGLSPRAGLGLLAAARAWALLAGRDHVLPEDVQVVLPTVAAHRLQVPGGAIESRAPEDVARLLIEAVPPP
jgi:MoxR-like ATPase